MSHQSQDKPTKFRRHFLTGEWEEVPCDTEDGIATYVHRDGKVVEGKGIARENVSAWVKPWRSRGLGVPRHQVAQANAAAAAAGTGAYYTPDGVCNCPSRSSRNKELARKGKFDADAGYGDRVV